MGLHSLSSLQGDPRTQPPLLITVGAQDLWAFTHCYPSRSLRNSKRPRTTLECVLLGIGLRSPCNTIALICHIHPEMQTPWTSMLSTSPLLRGAVTLEAASVSFANNHTVLLGTTQERTPPLAPLATQKELEQLPPPLPPYLLLLEQILRSM